MAIILGLIVLIRPVNIMVIAFTPFIFESRINLSLPFHKLLSSKKKIALSLLLFFLIVSIQPMVWHVQCGDFLVSSYGEEFFDFSNPNIFDFLFSYRKGFFVYSPIFFFLLLFASIHWVLQKSLKPFICFYIGFICLIYVLSCWWYWSYGASFGSRVMVDYYSILVLVIVPFIVNRKNYIKYALIPIVFLSSYVSIIQTTQYKNFILTWDTMTKEGYWRVFLKTDSKYKGLLWQENINSDLIENEILVFSGVTVDDLSKSEVEISFDITETHTRLAVLVLGSCSINKGVNRLLVAIDDADGNNVYYHEKFLFHSTGFENYFGSFELKYFD